MTTKVEFFTWLLLGLKWRTPLLQSKKVRNQGNNKKRNAQRTRWIEVGNPERTRTRGRGEAIQKQQEDEEEEMRYKVWRANNNGTQKKTQGVQSLLGRSTPTERKEKLTT